MQSARKHTSIKLQRLNNMLQNIHEPVVWDSDEELPHVNPEDTIELMGYN